VKTLIASLIITSFFGCAQEAPIPSQAQTDSLMKVADPMFMIQQLTADTSLNILLRSQLDTIIRLKREGRRESVNALIAYWLKILKRNDASVRMRYPGRYN
jgi:hypothetical protein